MSSVSFRVIENYEPVVDYEEFKKDFLNPSTRVDDLKKKYDLSNTRWKKYRARVLKEEGINRKPYTLDYCGILKNIKHDVGIKSGWEYIQLKPNGYIIVKRINNKPIYFGRYATLECAQRIRDKLFESSWDLELGEYYKLKYGMEQLKPAKIKALQRYDEFEELYIYSDLRVLEILDKLELTSRMHQHLMSKLREEYGKVSRNALRRRFGVESIK